MRFIDRWLGVPLTIAATACAYLSNLLRRECTEPKKVLLIKLSEMGSTICAEPAIEFIKKCTNSTPFFVVFKKSEAVLSLMGTDFTGRVFTIRTDSLFILIWDTLGLFHWSWREGIDSVIDFELFSCYSALLALFSGASLRIGFQDTAGEGLFRGDLFTKRILYSPHEHVAKNYERLARALPGAGTDCEVPLTASKKEISRQVQEEVSRLLNSLFSQHEKRDCLVVVNANASDLLPQRRWPMPSFKKLIERLLAHDEVCLVVLTGTKDEKPELRELVTALGSNRCAEVAGQLSLEAFVALLNRARIFLSNDSGPAHFASKSHVPTIVLFGPETPLLYKPLGDNIEALYGDKECSPCVSAANMKFSGCLDNQCMKELTVEVVLSKMEQLLDRSKQ